MIISYGICYVCFMNNKKKSARISGKSKQALKKIKVTSKPEIINQQSSKHIAQASKKDNRTSKRVTGDIGEDVACKFLVKHGFDVIDRNYSKKYGELDIVSHKNGVYHFIEVKTVTNVIRETPDMYRPEDNIHPWKQRRLRKIIETYINDKKIWEFEWQIDVITVFLNMETRMATVNFIKDIVL